MTNEENGPKIRGSGETLWVVIDRERRPIWWATALLKIWLKILRAVKL